MMHMKIDIPSHAFTTDYKRTKKAFAKMGQEWAAVARKVVRSSGGKASKRTRQRSQPGEAPYSQTGQLVRGIRAKPLRKGLGVSLKDSVFYAKMLETGATGGGIKGVRNNKSNRAKQSKRVMERRPFLSKALEMRKASFEQRIKEAVTKDIEFKKLKA